MAVLFSPAFSSVLFALVVSASKSLALALSPDTALAIFAIFSWMLLLLLLLLLPVSAKAADKALSCRAVASLTTAFSLVISIGLVPIRSISVLKPKSALTAVLPFVMASGLSCPALLSMAATVTNSVRGVTFPVIVVAVLSTCVTERNVRLGSIFTGLPNGVPSQPVATSHTI